jgi:hypothetical protein
VRKVREKLAVGRQTIHKFCMERFSLKKLKEIDGKEQYFVEISNRFLSSENLGTAVGINRA